MILTSDSYTIYSFINCFPSSWKCKGLSWHRCKIVFAQQSLSWFNNHCPGWGLSAHAMKNCISPPWQSLSPFLALLFSTALSTIWHAIYFTYLFVFCFDSPHSNERPLKEGICICVICCCISSA